jgi:hypothetical protein
MLIRFPVDICNPQLENDTSKSLALGECGSLRDIGVKESNEGLSYILHDGKLMFQSAMTEVIVRQVNKSVEWDDVWHQLYFSFTQNLFVVHHQGNRVTGMTPSYLTRTGGLRRAIENSKTDLKNVEILLRQMRFYLVDLIGKRRQKKVIDSKVKLQFSLFDDKPVIEIYELFTPSNIAF